MKIRITAFFAVLCSLCLIFAGCLPGAAQKKEASPAADALTEQEFFKIIDSSIEYGKKFEALIMDETAAYFYGFAGASVSAMRLAVEKILWLKGEGDDFDSLAAGSRYTDWDVIAEICYASPYPYYFEGLIHSIQGEDEEAAHDYACASVMGNFPEKGLDFYYFKSMSVSKLYDLRDKLRGYEDRIYAEYRPVIYGYERTPYNFSADYLCADAMELLDAGKYEEAVIPALYAVRIRPKAVESWICAITAATYADEAYKATKWLEEALRYFPDHEGLNALASSFNDVNNENGGQE